MALVDHVGDIDGSSCFPLVVSNFVKDTEDLVGIDRSQGKVVVGVAAVVEVESAEQIKMKQPCDDLLDILPLGLSVMCIGVAILGAFALVKAIKTPN